MGNKAIPLIISYDPDQSVDDSFVKNLVNVGKEVLLSAALRAKEKILSD